MSELRWILLGAGVALILGLWWRESRQPDADEQDKPRRPVTRSEPKLGEPGDSAVEESAPAHPMTAAERTRVNRRPPVIEIPDDLEVDVSDFVSLDRRKSVVPVVEEPAPMSFALSADDQAMQEDRKARYARDQDDQFEPWIRTQPLHVDQIAPRGEAIEPVPEDPRERETMLAAKQRIVALRLVTSGDRWAGTTLRAALEAENLRYGRYSVFHREREDGKSIFYVASMMEPGSFNLDTMDSTTFPGVSLFAVVPGPVDAPTVFDQMLASARRLADRMKGRLQDEQGSTLTAQRILNLREELVHLEHLSKRLRRT